MTALMAARLHCALAGRRHSDVFHLYVGPKTPSGRTPRGARPVCNARTRPLTILRRCGVTVDAHGRRLCARCSARVSASARRAEQPPLNHQAEVAFWEASGVTSIDLIYALAAATTVDDTHAIGHVANILHGFVPSVVTGRPTQPGKAQARYDFEVELIRRRDQLRLAGRTPEEVAAAEAKREADTARIAQANADRKQADRIARAVDRKLAGRYLMPHEQELLDNSA